MASKNTRTLELSTDRGSQRGSSNDACSPAATTATPPALKLLMPKPGNDASFPMSLAPSPKNIDPFTRTPEQTPSDPALLNASFPNWGLFGKQMTQSLASVVQDRENAGAKKADYNTDEKEPDFMKMMGVSRQGKLAPDLNRKHLVADKTKHDVVANMKGQVTRQEETKDGVSLERQEFESWKATIAKGSESEDLAQGVTVITSGKSENGAGK